MVEADNCDTGCRFLKEKLCVGMNRSARVASVLRRYVDSDKGYIKKHSYITYGRFSCNIILYIVVSRCFLIL